MFFEFSYLAIGIGIGLIASIPVGPVNVMVVRHAVQRGALEGFLVGLGATVADLIYAFIAVRGISAVTGFIEGQTNLIKLVGGLLLLGFGLRVLNSRSDDGRSEAEEVPQGKILEDALGAFAITITNPGVVLGFIALIGALGSWRPEPNDAGGAIAMIVGIGVGALIWWITVSAAVSHMSNFIHDKWLAKANRLSGLVLMVFGGGILMDLLITFVFR